MIAEELHDVSCVVHVHTTHSDGTATVAEGVAAAGEAGADALLITDHNTLAARREGAEGTHAGVLVLVGSEVSATHGHYLAFGLSKPVSGRRRPAGETAEAVRAAGGIGFAAHPFSGGSRMLVPSLARRVVRPLGWPALYEERGCDGIELWSLTTDAGESWRTPLAAARWLLDPEAAVALGPPEHHLRAWDALCARGPMPAIGGIDAHQHGVRVRGRVRSPTPNVRMFALLRTHLLCGQPLTGELDADRTTVLDALRSGSAWLACPHVADPTGAQLWAEGEQGEIVAMGGSAAAGAWTLRVRLPLPADVRVLREGTVVHAAEQVETLEHRAELPGAHRVEARIDGRLWLLSNPLYLRAG